MIGVGRAGRSHGCERASLKASGRPSAEQAAAWPLDVKSTHFSRLEMARGGGGLPRFLRISQKFASVIGDLLRIAKRNFASVV